MKININDNWSEYELLDSGNQKKLERFGKYILIRPESSANHKPFLSETQWREIAHTEFVQTSRTAGVWKSINDIPVNWNVILPNSLGAMKLTLKKTGFKHVGVFPEQIINWQFISEYSNKPQKKMLNLFGYTGVSSLVAAACGFSIVHVDALKQLVNWGKEMMIENELDNIRWICDDAPSFVNREIKRENKYDLILMDPPAFGLGKPKKTWKIEKHLLPLLSECKKILNSDGVISLSLYTEKIHLEKIIREIDDIGYTLLKNISIQGSDSHGRAIDHGNIIRFTVS